MHPSPFGIIIPIICVLAQTFIVFFAKTNNNVLKKTHTHNGMSHELGYALAFFYKKSTRVFVQASKD
jgi:hypothetical protein